MIGGWVECTDGACLIPDPRRLPPPDRQAGVVLPTAPPGAVGAPAPPPAERARITRPGPYPEPRPRHPETPSSSQVTTFFWEAHPNPLCAEGRKYFFEPPAHHCASIYFCISLTRECSGPGPRSETRHLPPSPGFWGGPCHQRRRRARHQHRRPRLAVGPPPPSAAFPPDHHGRRL